MRERENKNPRKKKDSGTNGNEKEREMEKSKTDRPRETLKGGEGEVGEVGVREKQQRGGGGGMVDVQQMHLDAMASKCDVSSK